MRSFLFPFFVGGLAVFESVQSDSMIRGAGGARDVLYGISHRGVEDTFPVDISSYSLRFDQCQGVKVPHVDTEDEAGTVQRYVVFRLCPRHDCSSCDKNYGEYVMELTDYLQVMSRYIHETKGALCETCNHCQVPEEKDVAESDLEDFNSNCRDCTSECDMLDKLDASSYVDATEFAECSSIHSDPNGESYYAGPVCAQGGEAISIGIFRDEYCAAQDTSKSLRDFLVDKNGKHNTIAYSFMKLTYTETCFSCMEDQVEGLHDLNNDKDDADTVKGFCEDIYSNAQKCEVQHGFAFADKSNADAAEEERETCGLIHKMKARKKHKRNGNQGEQFIEDDASKVEERKMLDKQTLIVFVVGLAFSCLLILCKLCNKEVAYSAVSNDLQAHDEDDDESHVKYSDDKADVTEEESTISTSD